MNDFYSRKAQGLVFFGYCPCCAHNTECSNRPEILPIVDCHFHTFPGKGLLVHRTDYKRVNNHLMDFILDCDRECCVCTINPQAPAICPTSCL